TNRGYTGHEHLDAFHLINANARLYDPVCARFLSPDNFVQSPSNSTGFNRYAYCMNNPVVYTDPDGEFWFVPVIVGAVIGGYAGGVISTGYWTPWGENKWSEDNYRGWKGATVGAIIGGGISTFSVGALTSGQVATSFTGKLAWSSVSQGFLSGNLGILSSLTRGENLIDSWKLGAIGFGVGLLSGGLGSYFDYINEPIDVGGPPWLMDKASGDVLKNALTNSLFGFADRYNRHRSEGLRGGELFGYSMMGAAEGALCSISTYKAFDWSGYSTNSKLFDLISQTTALNGGLGESYGELIIGIASLGSIYYIKPHGQSLRDWYYQSTNKYHRKGNIVKLLMDAILR
ncbi:MAG: RHS repeat-associated core domain-containing protein, partial [Bacteroidetes bacterium]|nr:RHS repeat-associated core domain-containing protein [Bacteroidota bacterium]